MGPMALDRHVTTVLSKVFTRSGNGASWEKSRLQVGADVLEASNRRCVGGATVPLPLVA